MHVFNINVFCFFNRIQVENSFIDEKADACSSLGELATNIG